MNIFFKILIFCFSFSSILGWANSNQLIVESNVFNMFTLKGYDFPYQQKELLFPIQLGEGLIIEKEEVEYFPGGSYQVTFLLKSPQNGKSQTFKSRKINNEEYETIIKAEVINRDIKRYSYAGNVKDFNCYYITITFEITLEDESVYTLYYQVESKIDSKKVAEKIADSMVVQAGDLITFGKDQLHYYHDDTNKNYNYHFTPQIFDQNNHKRDKGDLILHGPLRASNPREGREDRLYKIFCRFPFSERVGSGVLGHNVYVDEGYLMAGFGNFAYFRAHSNVDLSVDMELQFIKTFVKDGITYYRFKDRQENQIDFYLHVPPGERLIRYILHYWDPTNRDSNIG